MKILILQPSMCMGGVERSLLEFLNLLGDDYQIDLFLLNKTGVLFNQIDKNKINIINSNTDMIDNKKSKFSKFSKYFNLIINKNYVDKYNFLSNVFYDVAIVYNGLNLELLEILNYKVNATKKCAFIHGDPRFASKFLLKKAFDYCNKIICVSESCKNQLITQFENCKNRVAYLYNYQDLEEITSLSKKYQVNYDKSKINVLSVARFSKEKGHIRLIKLINKLKKEGITNCVFHFIGDGKYYPKAVRMVKKYKLEKHVNFYGACENPYPYFVGADFFILMSYNEAAPMVIGECNMLKLPILSTNTISAKEMIKNGVVCENNKKDLYESLKYMIKHLEQYKSYTLNFKLQNAEDFKKNFSKIIKED